MWLDPFGSLERFRRHYGSRFTVRASTHPPLVFISDPDEIRSVLTAPERSLCPGQGARTVSPIVGHRSFMLSAGHEHRSGRKAVTSAFRVRAVQRHEQMVREVVHRALASWPRDETVALHPRLRALTLEVLLRTIAGRFHGPLDGELRLLRDRVLDMLDITPKLVFVESRLRRGPGAPSWERFLRLRAEVDELLYALIEARLQARAGRQTPVEPGRMGDESAALGESEDLIGVLAAQRNADGSLVTPKQIRDSLMSVVLAGHETTASQLAWAFQLLAHNPRVQRAIVAEMRRGAGEAYLTATIQEILRRRCIFVFAIPRAVLAPFEVGRWRYETPAHLLPCIYLLHHDPRLYVEPHAFRPERFLDALPSSSTWLPWGGGRKRCPGLNLALLEMKVLLAAVLDRVTVEPAAPRLERAQWRAVVVAPHAGSRVVLRTRTRACMFTAGMSSVGA
jgi:cytochrome P450